MDRSTVLSVSLLMTSAKSSILVESSPMALVFFLLFFHLCADSMAGTNGNSSVVGKNEFENVGFLRNVPSRLKSKFSACDEFLQVEWIDRENRIGYSTYDIYLHGRHIDRFTALVYLKDYYSTFKLNVYGVRSAKSDPPYNYRIKAQISDYRYPYFNAKERLVTDNFDGLLSMMNELDSTNYPPPFGTTLNDKTTGFRSAFGTLAYSLSEFRKNICVLFPDATRVWFAEFRAVESKYNKEEVDEIFRQVREYYLPERGARNPKLIRTAFDFVPALDVNRDGVDDLYLDERTIYSTSSGYKSMKDMNDTVCSNMSSNSLDLQLTSDGLDYYLFNQCNLTRALTVH